MRRFAPVLLPVALLACLAAQAGEVYTWKDAKGVTHYADSPPAGQKHSTRNFSSSGVTAAVPAAKPAANSDCTNARSNLTLLQGNGKVGVDENKDGKIDRELTAAERATRLKLAEAQIETYCTPGSAPAQQQGSSGA